VQNLVKTSPQAFVSETVRSREEVVIMLKGALFVCTGGTGRAHLAASLLQATGPDHREAWWSAAPGELQGTAMVEQILHEHGRVPLAADRCVVPTSTMALEDMVILCDGVTHT
jgi:hypothetical protein